MPVHNFFLLLKFFAQRAEKLMLSLVVVNHRNDQALHIAWHGHRSAKHVL